MPGKSELQRFVFIAKKTADEIKHYRSMHKAWCKGNGFRTPFTTHRGCECFTLQRMSIFRD